MHLPLHAFSAVLVLTAAFEIEPNQGIGEVPLELSQEVVSIAEDSAVVSRMSEAVKGNYASVSGEYH